MHEERSGRKHPHYDRLEKKSRHIVFLRGGKMTPVCMKHAVLILRREKGLNIKMSYVPTHAA